MRGRRRFLPVYLLFLLTGGYLHFHTGSAVPVARPLSDFPTVVREWRMTSQNRFSDEVISILKPTDYLSRMYERGADRPRISVYIGFHDGGRDSGEIHSPRQCLPGNGWQQLSAERIDLDEPLGRIRLVKSLYQKGNSRELFLYWFQLQDRTLSDEYSLKLAEITGSVIRGRKDASFIRVSVPCDGDEHEAAAEGVRFIRDFYPAIRQFLPA